MEDMYQGHMGQAGYQEIRAEQRGTGKGTIRALMEEEESVSECRATTL